MSKRLARRPTENQAIGNTTRTRPAWNIGLLLADRATARDRLDRYADHLLGHRIQRTLAGGKVGA